jgi:two-component system, chemotaxis family, protein-glutamate methylesterase/glutaminase
MARLTERARDIVVVGASAGGVQAVRFLLQRIPPGFAGSMFIVLHRSPHFESMLPEVLRGRTEHFVGEPHDLDPVEPGRVYVAPRDLHLMLDHSRVRLVRGPKEHFTRPAVDPLFRSAAAAYGPRVVGIVLTGGGSDGLDGLLAIKAAGGLSLVQDPAEAETPSMPMRAISQDDVDAVLRLDAIADTVVALTDGTEQPAPARRMTLTAGDRRP